MHGGGPAGRNEYHTVVAIFDAATSERVSDATVRANVSGRDIYAVKLEIQRPSTGRELSYDKR
jgi:hypothetical protein